MVEPIQRVAGRMVPLDRDNVDTDQIMPKQHLKRIDRLGFGEFVFQDWRQDPAFVLNDPRYAGAEILVSGANFGAGSSREHAVWGLQQYGFRAIVAPTFGDIFRNNATNARLLTVAPPEPVVRSLLRIAADDPAAELEIDLTTLSLRVGDLSASFHLDHHAREAFLTGMDHIDQALRLADEISRFEAARPRYLPRFREVNDD